MIKNNQYILIIKIIVWLSEEDCLYMVGLHNNSTKVKKYIIKIEFAKSHSRSILDFTHRHTQKYQTDICKYLKCKKK